MSETQRAGLSPETILAEMKKNGVTHVVWLPDRETNWLHLLMQAEPSLTLVGVNREGLAFSAAAGISAGGKHPLKVTRSSLLVTRSCRMASDEKRETSHSLNGKTR